MMNSNIINFNLIDESQELKVELLDDDNEINFTMTDYDDSDIKDEISNIETQVNTNTTKIAQNKADIQALDNRVDQIPIVTKTSQLTNDSGFITDDYHDDTKQNKLVSGQNIKTINDESILGSGNIAIESGAGDYPDLTNLPSINNVTLLGNKTSSDLGLQPAGNYTTFRDVNFMIDELGEEIDDLFYQKTAVDTMLEGKANVSDVPTQLSQLGEDTTHRVVTDTEKENWNNKSNFSGAYNDTTGKPAITHTVATIENRHVTLSETTTTIENTQPILNYGAFNFIPLDMSSYNSSATTKALLPEIHLPAGIYIVTEPGYMKLGSDNKQLDVGTIIYWRGEAGGGELDLIGYNACEYWGYDSQNDEWSGGYFTTEDDVKYIAGEIVNWVISSSNVATGTVSMNDGTWYRRYRPAGITKLTFNFPATVENNYKSRVTCKTASTFSEFVVNAETYDIYFYGDDCSNGVLTGVPDKYYDIQARGDGFGGVIVEVHSHSLPTT